MSLLKLNGKAIQKDDFEPGDRQIVDGKRFLAGESYLLISNEICVNAADTVDKDISRFFKREMSFYFVFFRLLQKKGQ